MNKLDSLYVSKERRAGKGGCKKYNLFVIISVFCSASASETDRLICGH